MTTTDDFIHWPDLYSFSKKACSTPHNWAAPNKVGLLLWWLFPDLPFLSFLFSAIVLVTTFQRPGSTLGFDKHKRWIAATNF